MQTIRRPLYVIAALLIAGFIAVGLYQRLFSRGLPQADTPPAWPANDVRPDNFSPHIYVPQDVIGIDYLGPNEVSYGVRGIPPATWLIDEIIAAFEAGGFEQIYDLEWDDRYGNGDLVLTLSFPHPESKIWGRVFILAEMQAGGLSVHIEIDDAMKMLNESIGDQ